MKEGRAFRETHPVQPRGLPTIHGIPLESINKVFTADGLGAIFLGDIDAARDKALLKRLDIHAVLTVCKNSGLYYPREDVWLHRIICAQDEEDYDLSRHFEQTYYFLQEARRRTHVLVHCEAGVSRSPTIVIAYLMRKYRWQVDKAYRHVKARRRLTCPNLGFCHQLKRFEEQLGLAPLKREENPESSLKVKLYAQENQPLSPKQEQLVQSLERCRTASERPSSPRRPLWRGKEWRPTSPQSLQRQSADLSDTRTDSRLKCSQLTSAKASRRPVALQTKMSVRR